MPGRITPESLERVRDATDMVALVSSYVTLKRSGKSFLGLCPFHEEKTPSFSVMPDRGRYHCFGCGEKGSAFDFVIAMDRVTFPEAAEILADRAGVTLERDEVMEPARTGPAKNDLMRANAWAAEFFRRRLLAPEGEACRAYLAGRGISSESIERFGIGYAPAPWETLAQAAARKGIAPGLLVEAGLVKAREGSSGHYDRFRDRLVFPIRDPMERIVGFGGRCLDGQEPKYLNSPETVVFSKGRCLFGVDSLRGMKFGDVVYVMEGYTDVVMASQSGCDTAVATLGTSLTEAHARVLSRYTDKIVLVFDGDAAGRKAAERGAELFCAVDLDLRVSRLPAGEDPCEFLLARGAAGVGEMAAAARDFFDFVLGEVRARHDLESMAGRLKAVDELLRLARSASNPVKQSLVLDRISEGLDVPRRDLDRRMRGERRPTRAARPAGEPAEAADPGAPPVTRRQAQAEIDVLSGLVNAAAGQSGWLERLREDDFEVPEHRRLLQRLRRAAGDGGRPDLDRLLLDVHEDGERRALNRLVDDGAVARGWEEVVEGALAYFLTRRKERELEAAKAEGLSDGSFGRLVELLQAKQGLRRKRPAHPAVPPPGPSRVEEEGF